MNLSRCQRGHFYDAEKYSSCPHCAGGAGADSGLTAAFTDDLTVPNFVAPTAPNMGFGTPTATNAEVPTMLQEQPPIQQVQPVMPPAGMEFPIADIPADQATIGGIISGESLTVPLEGEETDTDHTIGFYDSDLFTSAPGSTNKTAAHSQPANKLSSPCVGWLIALGGNHIGTDFRLKVGKNYIGRSAGMDVALTNDVSVSREKHAIVVYEPKEHLYLVQPGEASTLVYKNESVVLEPARLEAYDVINVGDVNLLFIPLCNKQFNWSNLLEEMRKNNEK